MKIANHIVADFFAGRCSAEQQEEVLQYFESNPRALDDYLKYDIYGSSYNIHEAVPISDETSKRLLSQIHSRIEKSSGRKTIAGRITAAAIFLGVIISSLLFFQNRQDEGIDKQLAVVAEPRVIQRVNHTGKIEKIQLPDQSIVTLYNNSCISYVENFEGIERRISIDGEADFKVAKDASKPFIVTANNIATKALGTSFKVSVKSRNITVQLYEGKVVVWNKNNDEHKYYLTPNHQVVYTVAGNSFVASSFGMNKPARYMAVKSAKSPVRKSDIFSFENVPLKDAFDKLANVFDVQIEYSTADLQGIFLIASYSKDEPVEPLLQHIAEINNLKLVKNSEKYYSISH
ncbi:FecR family protein [Niabella sp. 22666]|uniref:FecR family protein n=1 Tax=Niabella sp. 22666 TaxID=3453954 RepID=UPI003F86B9F5